MPSPFPGMDPFIEGYVWHDFHGSLIFAIRDLLVPSIRPRYFVRSEERVYLVHEMENGQSRHIQPDLLVGDTRPGSAMSTVGAATVLAVGTRLNLGTRDSQCLDRYYGITGALDVIAFRFGTPRTQD